LVDELGETPLPPYLRRAATREDATTYQTVYSNTALAGSVAAPTAGLHFTPEVLDALHGLGVTSSKLALHVGAGTFKPVNAATLGAHEMHSETFSIEHDAVSKIAATLASGKPLIPVGTTSARVLESLYWLGATLPATLPAARTAQPASTATEVHLGHLAQWAAYKHGLPLPVAPAISFGRLLERSEGRRLSGSTSLCIAPGYPFAVCDGIVTNFHQPDSSLMLLVAALLGGAEHTHSLYAHALRERYRFLSYGDSSLLLRRGAN